MTNRFWRYIKKAFLLHLFVFGITWIVVIFFGITTTLDGLIEWIGQNPLLAILGFFVLHLVIEGFFIEAINKMKIAN